MLTRVPSWVIPSDDRRETLTSYGTACLAVLGAVLLAEVTDVAPFPLAPRFLLAAVVVAARWGGVGPSIAATLISVLVLDWHFVGPGVLFENTNDTWTDLCTFLLVAGVMASMTVNLRAKRDNLRKMVGELANSDERLRDSERRFRDIADIAPVIMWTCDADGNTTYVNYAWSEFLGANVGDDDDLGLVGADAVHPDDYNNSRGHVMRVMHDRVPSETIIRMRRFDGEYRWMFIRSAPIFNQHRQFTGWVGSAQDVSPWKEAEKQCAELVQSKRDFVAVMSHELRTPLSAILGYVELLEMDIPCPIPAEAKGELKRVDESARRLLTMIERVLQFSDIEKHAEVAMVRRINLREELQIVRGQALAMAKQRGLSLVVDDTYAARHITTDPSKLRQILINLITNAITFTKEGTIFVRAWHEDDRVFLSVTDPGVGISHDHLHHIFEPFWQVRQSMVREVGGLGLGLSVAQRLAELLGGELTVASAVGEGSTFTLALPK